ncbi:hypothetical protein DFH09DRAFT_1329971 [Mycena vulgaris]|nr:hypothetical protein DFH09DRAFT_1329971 [Mycena vulgaris]
MSVAPTNGESASRAVSFQSISVLEITASPEVDAVISHLTAPSLAPCLTAITLFANLDPEMPDIEYETIVEMCHHRRHPTRAAQLRRFHLKLNLSLFDRTPGDPPHPWYSGYLAGPALKRLIADGLDFRVTFEDSASDDYFWPSARIGAERAQSGYLFWRDCLLMTRITGPACSFFRAHRGPWRSPAGARIRGSFVLCMYLLDADRGYATTAPAYACSVRMTDENARGHRLGRFSSSGVNIPPRRRLDPKACRSSPRLISPSASALLLDVKE